MTARGNHLTQSKYSWMEFWWYVYPSEKYELVSWDDDIPNRMEK